MQVLEYSAKQSCYHIDDEIRVQEKRKQGRVNADWELIGKAETDEEIFALKKKHKKEIKMPKYFVKKTPLEEEITERIFNNVLNAYGSPVEKIINTLDWEEKQALKEKMQNEIKIILEDAE